MAQKDHSDPNTFTWPCQLTRVVHRTPYPEIDPSKAEFSARGKKVIITGASGGLGKAIAEAWAIAGAEAILLTGRRLDALNEIAAKIKETARPMTLKILVVPADVTSEVSVQELFTIAKKEIGTFDVLINDAGTLNYAAIDHIEPSKWWNDY
ncbi:MAG: hypothetical protein Q9165_004523, partial [Trypethelium subeluteriae]